MEYGLNETRGKQAAKACELVWILHLVLYFIGFSWHQLKSDCLLPCLLHTVCKHAEAFLKTARRAVKPGSV